jgi:hypothetical protein
MRKASITTEFPINALGKHEAESKLQCPLVPFMGVPPIKRANQNSGHSFAADLLVTATNYATNKLDAANAAQQRLNALQKATPAAGRLRGRTDRRD